MPRLVLPDPPNDARSQALVLLVVAAVIAVPGTGALLPTDPAAGPPGGGPLSTEATPRTIWNRPSLERDGLPGLARAATLHQFGGLAIEGASPASPDHPSTQAALEALWRQHGGGPLPSKLDHAGPTSPQVDATLAALVEAFLAYDGATGRSFAGTDLPTHRSDGLDRSGLHPAAGARDRIAGTLVEGSSRPGPDPVDQDPGPAAKLAPVRSAQIHLVETAIDLAAAVDEAGASTAPTSVDLCPTLALDLAGEDSTYETACRLIVDVGGNDTYLNNAGGSNLFFGQCDPEATGVAAAVVDLSGDDRYGDPASPRSCGANGGGYHGAGALVDLAGDDIYAGNATGVNGGGFRGAGMLVDQQGDDKYRAGVGVSCRNCTVGARGVNGGALWGTGLLLDGTGADTYQAGVGVTCAGSCDVGVRGANGGGSLGTGALLDGSGPDTYQVGANVTCGTPCEAGTLAVNGGGFGGDGLLADRTGDDVYDAGVGVTCGADCNVGDSGVNGGGWFGTGRLVDSSGSDTYRAGVGVACDRSCEIGSFGANGGAGAGTGLLWDGSGDDAYQAGADVDATCPNCTVGSVGVNGGGWFADAMLLDVSGRDSYADNEGGTGTDRTVVPKGSVGAQVDADDPSAS